MPVGYTSRTGSSPSARREVNRAVFRNARGEVNLTGTSTEWAVAAASPAAYATAVVDVGNVVRTRQGVRDAGPGADSGECQTAERQHGGG